MLLRPCNVGNIIFIMCNTSSRAIMLHCKKKCYCAYYSLVAIGGFMMTSLFAVLHTYILYSSQSFAHFHTALRTEGNMKSWIFGCNIQGDTVFQKLLNFQVVKAPMRSYILSVQFCVFNPICTQRIKYTRLIIIVTDNHAMTFNIQNLFICSPIRNLVL